MDGEEAVSDTDDIPVRLLHDVSIVEQASGEMIPLAQLLEVQLGQTGSYIAMGRAKPWLKQVEDDEDDEEEESEDNEEDEEEGTEQDDDDDDAMSVSDDSESSIRIRTSRILEMTFYHYDGGKMDQ